MSKPVVAAQLYTVRDWMRTPEEIATGLRKIKEIGYSAVQISGIGSIDPSELKDLLEQNQLTACATHVSWERLNQDLDQLVTEHKLWDCKYVGLGSMPNDYQTDRNGWVRFAKEASEIGKKLLDHDLQFIYHNHAFEFIKFDGVTGLEILLQESDPDAFHFEIDTYWIQIGGANPVTWIRKVADRMKVVHFKDMGNAGKNEPVMAEVGEGNLEWEAIIQACQDIGVEYAAVEQDYCAGNPFDSLKISYDNLKYFGL